MKKFIFLVMTICLLLPMSAFADEVLMKDSFIGIYAGSFVGTGDGYDTLNEFAEDSAYDGGYDFASSNDYEDGSSFDITYRRFWNQVGLGISYGSYNTKSTTDTRYLSIDGTIDSKVEVSHLDVLGYVRKQVDAWMFSGGLGFTSTNTKVTFTEKWNGSTNETDDSAGGAGMVLELEADYFFSEQIYVSARIKSISNTVTFEGNGDSEDIDLGGGMFQIGIGYAF